jgi:homoserine kinase type II
MSQSRRMFAGGGPARAAGLEFAATLLPLWGFPRDTDITPADVQGVNNQTFLVRHRQRRYVLRVTGFLSVAEVRAEHRITRRLRHGDLPFQVPEPVAALNGQTVIETPAGPATLCRWLPGVSPGTDGGMAFERLGRAVGVVDAALAEVSMGDALRDWRTDPRWVRPDDPPADVLFDELRSAGISAEQIEVLTAAARRAGRWWPDADGLPAQVIHGDITPANLLADPDTGEVTGLLDFELAGAGFRVQDVLAALYHSTALSAPDWPRRTAAFLRGCATVSRLEPAEVAALPELLIAQSLGSVLWRAVRWRAGLAHLGDVTARVDRLEASTRWLAANEDKFLSVAAAANARFLTRERSRSSVSRLRTEAPGRSPRCCRPGRRRSPSACPSHGRPDR